MSKFSLIYFLLWILLQILVDVNCQSMPFKPNVIYRHTATFVDNKLYILGGKDVSNGTLVKRFFYLDVSVLYDTQRLSWQDLSNINIIPLHTDATSAKGGVNNDTLYLYRGASSDKTMALVYTFDPNRTSWNPQKITMIRKWDLTGVVDSNGKFYLWGGVNDNVAVANDMLILDTTNLNLSEGSLVNALTPRFHYGATLLPNNKIIYMGGTNDINFGKTLNLTKGALALNEVYIYDTVNDNWDTKITMGNIPSKRVGFFTILGLDGQRIIIYGGYFNNPEYSNTTLYVLDLSNYNWYVPKISGKNPSSRTFHKANVIGKYMVISFGDGYDRKVESDILLLDISKNEEYIWTTKFDHSISSPSSSPSTSSSTLSPTLSPTLSQSPSSSPPLSLNIKLVGVIIGSLLSGIFLSVRVFFVYKWYKYRQQQKTIRENEFEKDIQISSLQKPMVC
ncbi:unnamed protein product [Rhizophagus irregularis]|nr:unnamed protein product [Rhizophagus irregularis]CAB5379099.1 unnamed protein product [Rhizophagus irregularis]